MALIENLQALMDKSSLNTNSLAEASGMAQPTIHRILKGEIIDPKDETLKPLAQYFGFSVAELKYSDLTASNLPPKTSKTEIKPSHKATLKLDDLKLQEIIRLFPRLSDKQRREIVEQVQAMASDNQEIYQLLCDLDNK